jgi:hypothetical protein
MLRHRFLAADSPEGRSLRDDGGVKAPRRSRRAIGVSVMLAARLDSSPKREVLGARSRRAQQTKMPRITALRLDWLFTPAEREKTRRLPALGEVK